eukprot:TRINITY_DN5006_c0_g1_i1.p1 TRINITY_DN5006_c0_g1~~TRINITY_DN5006_c0_g1_i1.p1  ORF type:complete len:687 (-),score=358.32 TRINITY_DN5006_c0_g1_i1:51-2009(-)
MQKSNSESLEKENTKLKEMMDAKDGGRSWREERKKLLENLRKMDDLVKEGNEKEIKLEKKIKALQEADKVSRKEVELTKEVENLKKKLRSKQKELQRCEGDKEALEKQVEDLEAQTSSSSSSSGNGGDGSTDKEGGGTRKAWAASDNPKIQQWEHEKKMQRKIDGLRKKLGERTEELEATKKLLGQCRDTIKRIETDKERLAAQVKEHQASGGTKKSIAKAIQSMEKVNELKDEILKLERDNMELRREVEVVAVNEKRTLEQENRRLQEQLAESKNIIAELESLDAYNRNPDEEREKRMTELKELNVQKNDTIKQLEGQLMLAESAALELRFDKEKSDMLLSKMEEKVSELETFRSVVSETFELQNISEAQVKKRMAKAKGQKELEKVVDALKRVIEKLQTENEALRKSAHSNVKYMELVKENKSLKASYGQMEEQMEALQEKGHKYDDLERRMRTLSEQSATLRRQVKQQQDSIAKYKKHIKDLVEEQERLVNALEESKMEVKIAEEGGKAEFVRTRALLESELERLQGEVKVLQHEVDHRTVQLGEVKKEVAKRGRKLDARETRITELEEKVAQFEASTMDSNVGSLQRQLAEIMPVVEALQKRKEELTRENKELKEELGAFDEQFFGEIEDLRFQHAEAMKKLKENGIE